MDPMCLYQYNPVNAYVLHREYIYLFSGRRLEPTKGPGCAPCNFFRSLPPVLHNYYLNNILFYLVFENTDLGVMFDSTFNRHYKLFQKKSSSILGFITRTCKGFSNLIALKTLYFSSERSTLEYNSIIW